jgi:DNA-binding GntR family transcriptional regulator
VAKGGSGFRRGGLAEHVYAHVKEQVLDGVYPRDNWLLVEQIAASLEVSRQPVMDALKRLSIEGFITIIPQVGCRIRSYTVEEITDFYRLFAEGEGLVAELAAERASEQDVLTLQVISAQIGALTGQSLPAAELSRQYRNLNRRLHFEIRRIARSSPLTEVVETLGDRSDFFIATADAPVFAERVRTAHDEHTDIIQAIIARQPQQARAMMQRHIAATSERLRAALEAAH